MKVQFKEAQAKPITVQLNPGDVAIVLRKDEKKPLNARHISFGTPEQAEEVSIGVGYKGDGISQHRPVYRVSQWR